jgi:lipopolysaccharide export system protein LptC
VSQLLTLYTTPVVYLYFDRLQNWRVRAREKHHGKAGALGSEA